MPEYDYSVLYEPMLQQFQYYVDVMLQALPVEMYGSFIESMEDIEERNYQKYLNDDYSDFESFMPNDEEE